MTSASGRWVRYGEPAADALRAEIARAKGDEPLAPVTVVVPSNQVGVSTRRLLASGRLGPVCGAGAGTGLIGVTFVTPYRLADLLGSAALAGQGRRPVSVPVLGAAIRSVLADEPGAFAPVAGHAATEAALVTAYRELRDLDDAALAALASSDRAAEVVRVARATRDRLAGAWYDEEDLMAAATAAIDADGAPADIGSVIVYLPQRLTHHAARLLSALGSVIVLAGATGEAKADAEVRRSVERLGTDLGPGPATSTLPELVSAATTSLLTASDADDEVRAAVRTVVDAVRDGTPLDRIAVLYAAREPYGRLLAHHLDAAGIAANGTATLAVAGRLAGRTLLGLLALPLSGFRRQDVFAWMSGAPVLHQGRWAPTSVWERVSRDAGVVAGRDDWDRRLAHLAERLTERADRLEAEIIEDDSVRWRIDRDRKEAERALSLRSFVLDLADRLAAAEAPAPWPERVRWTTQLLNDVLGGPTRRADWPDAERRAAERLQLALDRLAVLDDIETEVSLETFAAALAVELENDLGRVGRFGEGVLVGPVSMGVGVDLDLLVVVGMAEGTFPSTLVDDSLLPDEDRDRAGGSLPLRSGHVDRLHHQFLATLAGAGRQVLCIPKGDLRRSRERVPSRWALDVASVLAGETWWSEQLLEGDAPWLTHLASFDAAIRTATTPATEQEHRIRHLLAGGDVDPTDVLAAGMGTVAARWSNQITRFDGNLTGLPIPSPVDRGASATSLEAWAACPHGYFVRHILGVQPVEPPEDVIQITPMDRGTLVHQILEDFIAEAMETGRVPAVGATWSDADRDRLHAIARARFAEYEAEGLTGRTIFWARDQGKILNDLTRFLRDDDDRRNATGATPVATELPFGLGGTEPVHFPLSDGRTVPLRGKADRVDRAPDGTLHVSDYKTGSARSYTGISAEDPHQGGRRLQLAVYGLAARQHLHAPDAPVRAEYWFASSKGEWKKLGYTVDDDVLAEVALAMTTIVTGIEEGLFPPHPKPHSTSPFIECHACDPDGLGTTDLRRQFLRKLDDPALASYLDLVAPDGFDDEEDTP